MKAERIQFDDDEVVLNEVRKHWFVLFSQIMSVVIIALFPLCAYLVLGRLPVSAFVGTQFDLPLLVAFYAGWLILSWMGLFSIWTNYYLDVWTVTNKRLITVDQKGLFNRDTGSFRLERLQDINVSVHGVLPTLLKYGDLEAETASSDKNFVARSIPDPQGLKATILEAADSVTFAQKPLAHTSPARAPQQLNDGL